MPRVACSLEHESGFVGRPTEGELHRVLDLESCCAVSVRQDKARADAAAVQERNTSVVAIKGEFLKSGHIGQFGV